MRKIVRELEIISDTFGNDENFSELTQFVKISNLGVVRIIKLNAEGKITKRQRFRIDKSVVWRIFDLIDDNFELTTNYPDNFDYGFWTLRTYYNKTLTGEYRGPLMNLDNLGVISDSLRSLLDRKDLNLFDGGGITVTKRHSHFNLFGASTDVAKSYLNNSIHVNKIRIALVLLNDEKDQVYCRCDDYQIITGMMVWVKIDQEMVVGKVIHILFVKSDKLLLDQDQINVIVSQY